MAKRSAALSRRNFLNQVGIGAASAAALSATGCASMGSSAEPADEGGEKSLSGPYLDLFNSTEDNMIAYARLQGQSGQQ